VTIWGFESSWASRSTPVTPSNRRPRPMDNSRSAGLATSTSGHCRPPWNALVPASASAPGPAGLGARERPAGRAKREFG
jgi:hypothetical protein